LGLTFFGRVECKNDANLVIILTIELTASDPHNFFVTASCWANKTIFFVI